MRRSARRAGSFGFTLVECLLAVGILSMLSAALVKTMHGILKGYAVQREEAELNRGANLALRRMVEYGSIALSTPYPAHGYSAADSLAFRAGVDQDGDTLVSDDPAVLVVYRRRTNGDLEELIGGTARVVATNVIGFTAWHQSSPIGDCYIKVQLVVQGPSGARGTFQTGTYPSNAYARFGERTDE